MRGAERAQTTIDFAIGAGIFLLVIAFIFSFVPGMFQPFTGGQDRPLAADRAANRLSADVLGAPDQPYVLDRECTDAFFHNSSAPATCRYDATGNNVSSLRSALGLTDRISVNVTVENETGVVDLGRGPLAAGEPLPAGALSSASNGVVAARRSVSIGGDPCRLHVRVW